MIIPQVGMLHLQFSHLVHIFCMLAEPTAQFRFQRCDSVGFGRGIPICG
jgi:hypothetical protein